MGIGWTSEIKKVTCGVSWYASVFVSRGVMLDYGVKTARHGMGRAQVGFAL